MAQTSPYKTLNDITLAIIQDAKEATSTTMVSMVERWINEGYEKLGNRKKRKWLDQQIAVQLNAKVQADCTVTEGSTTVTFVGGTTFPSGVELVFWVPGFQEVYNVTSIASNVVTLSNAYLGDSSSAASGIVAQASMVLPDTVREVYQVYHQYYNQPLENAGPQMIRLLQERYGQQIGYATYYTQFGDSSNSRRILLYPYPDQAYTIYLDVNYNIQEMTNDTDEPLIPINFRQILYWYGIWKLWLFHRNQDQAAGALANFNQTLIELDGEMSPTLDFPQIQVSYPRPKPLRGFAPYYNSNWSDPDPFGTGS